MPTYIVTLTYEVEAKNSREARESAMSGTFLESRAERVKS